MRDNGSIKNALKIKDMMELFNCDNRTTFWRMRNDGRVPEPDIATGHPIWLRASLEKQIPNLTTSS